MAYDRNIAMLWRIYLLLILSIFSTKPLSAACAGKIDKGTTAIGSTAYDTFKGTDIVDELTVSVRNTGDEACGFVLAFRAPGAAAMLGGKLSYYLTNAAGRPLLIDTSANVSLDGRLPNLVPVRQSGELRYHVVIPRGQFIAPGRYSSAIVLELYAASENASPGSLVDSTTLQLRYDVLQSLSVNIKGAGMATTLDFGELNKGSQKNVILQVRGNQFYRLDVSSVNHGVMALTPPVPGQRWSIAYETRLDQRLLDLQSEASATNLTPSQTGEVSHDLLLTVGDVTAKRAGKYEDVITVKINASLP
jgi:hypothetical protein